MGEWKGRLGRGGDCGGELRGVSIASFHWSPSDSK